MQIRLVSSLASFRRYLKMDAGVNIIFVVCRQLWMC